MADRTRNTTREVSLEPKLVFRSGHSRGKVFAIDKDRITIGRDDRNDICIDDDIVSSRHVVVGRTRSVHGDGSSEETFWIEDLDSKNGTFVNGKRVRRVTLQEGDVFCLCQTGPEIQFTREEPKLPSIIATSTSTFVRTRSLESAVRELLPAKPSKGVVSATGVREIVGRELEKSSRKARQAAVFVGAGVSLAILAGFVILALTLGGSKNDAGSSAGPAVVAEARSAVRLELELEPIFSALFHSYREEGLGAVLVTNRGTLPIEDATLGLTLEGEGPRLLSEDIQVELEPIAPGETRRVPIRPSLARSVVTPRTYEVTAVAVLQGATRTPLARSSRAVIVQDYHAFNWQRPERISVFIDSSDDAVLALVDEAWKHRPTFSPREFPPSNVVGAITLLTSLAQRGLRYKPDAQTPVTVDGAWKAHDRVNYPGETLLRGTGDCDDLAVLVASLLESVDIPTAIVVSDGHVFVMFDTGLEVALSASPEDPSLVSAAGLLRPESYVVVDGRIWLPIEATALAGDGASFARAWTEAWGRKEAVESSRGHVVVRVRDAWVRFKALRRDPPEDVAKRIRDPQTWQVDGLREQVELAIEAFRAHGRRQLDDLVESLGKEFEGAGLEQMVAFAYASSGLYDLAAARLQAAIFGEPPPREIAAIRGWSGRVTREMAYLLNDLAVASTLASESSEDLGRSIEYYRLALDVLPGEALEVGEMMLRLGLLHRRRGELSEGDRWISKALGEHPSLAETYRVLQLGDGRVASLSGVDERQRGFLLAGLRRWPLAPSTRRGSR